MNTMALDIRTLLAILVVGNLASALILLIYRRGPDSGRAFRFFIAGKVLQAAAYLLLGHRGQIADLLSYTFGNGFLIAGNGLELLALITVRRPDRRWEWTFLAMTLAAIAALLGIPAGPAGRVGLASVIRLAFFGTAGIAILRDSAGSWLHRTVGALYLAFCVPVLGRTIVAFTAGRDFSLLTSGYANAYMYLASVLILFVSGIAFLLMGKEELDLEREEIIRQLQAALGDNRVLGGLLPICSSCKKIRDDQGYWNQIERYIAEHSDAEFTHGLCPDCCHQLFPDFVKAQPLPGINPANPQQP